MARDAIYAGRRHAMMIRAMRRRDDEHAVEARYGARFTP